MDVIIKRENQPSPFDQIKQVDTDGNEYWLARELMPILGYQQWRQFEDAISRAIAACENIEQESEKHFLRLTAKSTGGRPRDDFKLSRYGCYLTAMNGDPRKPEIAAAQSYFVVKTREAETQTQLRGFLSWSKLTVIVFATRLFSFLSATTASCLLQSVVPDQFDSFSLIKKESIFMGD